MADFDKSKFDPKAAAEARKAEMDEIIPEVAEESDELYADVETDDDKSEE